jgi:hypothetical protein
LTNVLGVGEATTDGMVPSIEKKEEMNMWVFRYSRFVRLKKVGERLTAKSIFLLPITLPIWIAQIVLIGIVLYAGLVIAVSIPRAIHLVFRAVHSAQASGETDRRPLRVRGGVRQRSFFEGSKARSGEWKSDDDLRRRLYELRSTRTGEPARRSLNYGGQNGKQ